MRMYDIIMKKRLGEELSKEEIAFFIEGFTRGDVPDYQASALCMAICFQGMSDSETAALTHSMAESGDTLDLSRFGKLSVDKHSTGGVGDKTSLIVGPIVAALGGKMAKMSGRGLGHTGGTVDKLEAIPGMRVTLSREDFLRQSEEIGLAITGQSGNLTPADKKLYALRDVTATVDSVPLITSSIMSKKLAAGARNIVLDVKYGSGAFMKTVEEAEVLAANMVNIGKRCGRNMAAVITSMEIPLGSNIGNILEVIEAAEILKGKKKDDLYEVCIALAAEAVILLRGIDHEKARALAEEAVESGAAYEKMKQWIAAQGGDVRCVEEPEEYERECRARIVVPVPAPADGFITRMDAAAIGSAAVILGAGRSKKDDAIDYSAGIKVAFKTGEYVKKGDAIAYLYTNRESSVEPACERYLSALSFGDNPPEPSKLIYAVIR